MAFSLREGGSSDAIDDACSPDVLVCLPQRAFLTTVLQVQPFTGPCSEAAVKPTMKTRQTMVQIASIKLYLILNACAASGVSAAHQQRGSTAQHTSYDCR